MLKVGKPGSGAVMEPEQYRTGVSELYQGEVLGEGLFSAMLAKCPEEHRHGMALLLQLESEAKVRLRPFLWRLGLSLVEVESERDAGIELAERWNAMPWQQAMRELAELVKPYRDRYQALEAAAPRSDKADVHFMVRHEMAVLRYAEFQVAGDPAAAVAEIRKELQYHWPAVPRAD